MKRTGVFGLLLVMLVTMALGTGCTKYASEEELQMLDDQRNAALQAEQALSDCESEATRLEREKAALQADLQDAKAEKAAVKQRMDEKDGMMKLDKNEGGR